MKQVFGLDRRGKPRGVGFGTTLSNMFGVGPSFQQSDQELSRYLEEAKNKNKKKKRKEQIAREDCESFISLSMSI